MRFARIAGRINKGVYTATFGIRLVGIRILTLEEHQSYEDFSMTLLGSQMDFIHSLHELAEDFAIELRYLFNPQEPHLIKVYFLVQVTGSKKSDVIAQDIYHRAVHAFDLGVMLGFLTKKPKGRVYYFCEIKNDIESGFPIKGGGGGGRSKTKDWLWDSENRQYLEKLEQKIEAVLTNMAGETFKKFNEDWQVFKNKATNNSKKQSAWQSSDGRKLSDYPVGCNDPMVLQKVKDSKGL